MLTMTKNIEVIENLLNENTPASLTYAALECRLTIEQLCYERLRMLHEFISHDDIAKWQPAQVVKTLMQEVDPYVTTSVKISISTESIDENTDKPLEDFEYEEIGTQVGFNPNKMGKLWNALANLALHIPVPKNKDVQISRYGDQEKVRKKVQDCLDEFRRLSETTINFTGFGDVVSFDCFGCSNQIKRKSQTLEHQQTINCIDPKCDESYKVEKRNEEFYFERRKVKFECHCGHELALAYNHVERSKLNEKIKVVCTNCNEENLIKWTLCKAQKN